MVSVVHAEEECDGNHSLRTGDVLWTVKSAPELLGLHALTHNFMESKCPYQVYSTKRRICVL